MYVGVDKFYPPQVDTPHFLFRDRIVDGLIQRCASRKPVIALEAQAGQGKTTVIKQFLDRLPIDSAWYQVAPEDADPAFFLAALHDCLSGLLSAPPRGADAKRRSGWHASCFDLPSRVDLLLEDLRASLKRDLYLVFDDLHYLAAHEASLSAISHLIENAPPKLHFILSSREPLHLNALRPRPDAPGAIRLGNRELALSGHEVADLFHQVFQITLSHDAIREITLKTDGWVMGALLFGLQMAQRQGRITAGVRDEDAGADIRDYFRRKIFAPLEQRLHAPLMLLSLLEDIPLPLARQLSGQPGIGGDLETLARRNIFIRRLGPGAASYRLHHLFRQFLRDKAEAELGAAGVREAHRRAGAYFLEQDNPLQALRHFLMARDYDAIETALRSRGASLLATNQTAGLTAILGAIPERDLGRMGWSSLILALAHLDFAPALALPLLSQALGVFASERDEPGELLCLAQIISIHITTTGHYREGEELLLRAEDIFDRIAGALEPCAAILAMRSLAMGRCIFLADADAAALHAERALALAREGNLVNFEAALLMVMGYVKIFAGQLKQAGQWLERAWEILRRSEVGTFNCLAIRMMLFNHLFHQGDFANYFDQKQQMAAAIGQVLFSQSIAGPFCHVWEMDIAINQGRLEDALAIAAQARALDPPLSPHLLSQVLQLKAVVLALDGQAEPAREAAAESALLRDRAGGLYFVTLNRLMTGLVHGLNGEYDTALALLTEGIEGSRRMPTEYLESCGLMHRGALHLRRGSLETASRDIGAGLGLMRRNDYRHFWAWPPVLAREVLGFAAARDIEAGYARKLARERFGLSFTVRGEPIPLLEFHTLGGLAVLCGDLPLLGAEDLTPAQRELLCMLFSAPGLKISQNRVQLHFWPDSPPASAKATFDTMISRLRKSLAEAQPGRPARVHLHRDKGMVWLADCRVDALDFLEAARLGLELTRQQLFWQASNAFARAASLWRGEFVPGATGDDAVGAFRQELAGTLARMALAWGGQLARANRLQPALDIVETALRADPLAEPLWALLHRLHGSRSSIQARQVANRFAALLLAEGYPEGEIAATVLRIARPDASA